MRNGTLSLYFGPRSFNWKPVYLLSCAVQYYCKLVTMLATTDNYTRHHVHTKLPTVRHILFLLTAEHVARSKLEQGSLIWLRDAFLPDFQCHHEQDACFTSQVKILLVMRFGCMGFRFVCWCFQFSMFTVFLPFLFILYSSLGVYNLSCRCSDSWCLF